MPSFAFSRRFLVVVSVIACGLLSLAFYSHRAFLKSEPASENQSALLLPTTATKVDSLAIDVDGDGRADPGDTLQYTVTIPNTSGADGTGVRFSDQLEANLTLVPNSLNSSPIAANESFGVYGNVSISVPDGASDLLANDVDPDNGNNSGLTMVTGVASSANCAGCNNVTVNANGSFTYDPPVGFAGPTDTFTYTVRDNGADGIGGNADDATDTGTVTLNISGMIWFVQAGATACTTLANQCGKLTKPFSSLDAFRAVNGTGGNAPAANQNIFVLESATASTMTAQLNLLSGQVLIGQDATPNATAINNAALFNFTLPANSAALPSTNTAGNAATVTAFGLGAVGGNTIRGLTITNTGANTKLGGNGFGTLTLGDITLSGTGKALDFTNGILAVAAGTTSFTSIDSTSSATQGISISSVGGNMTVGAGGTTISSSTTQGILVTGSTLNANFGNTAIGTGTGGTGGTIAISLQSNSSGTRTFGTVTIQNNNGPSNNALVLNSGGSTVFGDTSILNVPGTGTGIDIQSQASGANVSFGNTSVNKSASPGTLVNLVSNVGNITFGSLSGTASNGGGLIGTNNTGNIVVTNNTGSLSATNNPAVNITGASAASRTPINLNFTNLNSTASTTNGINLTNVSAVSGGGLAASGGTLQTSAGTAFNVNTSSAVVSAGLVISKTTAGGQVVAVNASSGNVSLSGNLTCNGGCTGLSVTNSTAGTYTFSGATKAINAGTNAGVTLSSNTGATMNFTNGGLDIDTTSGAGFAATGGGAVSVQTGGTANTIDTANGTPLNVTNTTIGAGGITFATITATANPANGIVLSGTSGAFQVTGATNLGQAAGSGPTGVGINVLNYSTGTISFAAVNINRRGNTGILVNNFDGSTATFGATTIPNQNNVGGYGIRIEESATAVTFSSATISGTNQITAQTDSNNDGVADTDGDGDAIFLKNNTGSFTLSGGSLTSSGGDGIDIRGATNVTVSGVTIDGVGLDVSGASVGGLGGHGIYALNVTGTNAITNVTITNWETSATNGLRWWNNAAGTGTMTLHGVTFSNSETGSGAIIYRADSTAVMTLNVGGTNAGDPCFFTNITGEAIGHAAGNSVGSTGTADLNVRNNSFTNNLATKGQNSISARNVEGGKAAVVISGNTFDGVGRTQADTSGVIDIGTDGLLAGNLISFSVTGNTIKNIGDNIANSCGALPCTGKRAIDVFIDDNGNVNGTILIDGNVITNVQRNGIIFDSGSAFNGVNFAAKITNNRVGIRADNTIDRVGIGTALSGGGESGIRIENRSSSAKNLNILVSNNLVYNGNGASGSSLNGSGIFVRAQNSATLSATVTSNTVNTNNSNNSNALRADTNFSAGVNATLCLDASSNTLTAPASADDINLNEIQGILNVEQASIAGLAAANPGSTAVIGNGTPQFGITCATPPAIAQLTDEVSAIVPKTSNIDINSLKPVYQTPADFLAALEPVVKSTERIEAISAEVFAQVNEEFDSIELAAQADIAQADRETEETGYWTTTAAFFKEVSNKLATAIIPTVYSQDKKADEEAVPEAAELICIDGDVDVDVGTCAGPGFTLPVNKTVTVTFRAQIANTQGLTQVSNQGTVSGTNFASYTTDDPDVVGTNNPTVTLLDATTVAVTSNLNPSVFGQNVTFTATLTGVPARVSGNPTGTVQFKDNGTAIGSPVNVVAGAVNTATAQVSISTLSVGNHVITAEYSGGNGFNANTGTLAGGQTVNKAGTTTGVVSSQNPSLTTQPVTFTATVNVTAPGAGTPTGSVTFLDGGVAIGACTNVALSGTTAQCGVSNLSAANHTITAVYNGDANFNVSAAGSMTGNPQVVSNTAVWDGSTSGDWNDATNWTTNFVPSAVHNVNIPAAGVTNQPIFGAGTTTVGSLTLGAGRSLTINNAATLVVTGVLTMSGNNIDATAGLLKLGTGATIARTSGLILGDVEKDFGATGAFTYPVGTATGFSPVAVNITALGVNPSSLRVRANDGTAPASPTLNDATTLDRYWTLVETGDLTANVTFSYLEADVDGTEANYRTIRVTGTTATALANGAPCPGAGNPCVDGTANTIFVGGLTAFSHWTAGEAVSAPPTAANVTVSGRVLTAEGRGVFNAIVTVTGADGTTRMTRTNPFGYYRFQDIPAGGIYTFNVRHKQYSFEPQVHSITDARNDLDFVAVPE